MVFNFPSTSEIWPDKRGSFYRKGPYKMGGLPCVEDNPVVFNFLSTSKIWPDKRGSFYRKGPYKKGGLP